MILLVAPLVFVSSLALEKVLPSEPGGTGPAGASPDSDWVELKETSVLLPHLDSILLQ